MWFDHPILNLGFSLFRLCRMSWSKLAVFTSIWLACSISTVVNAGETFQFSRDVLGWDISARVAAIENKSMFSDGCKIRWEIFWPEIKAGNPWAMVAYLWQIRKVPLPLILFKGIVTENEDSVKSFQRNLLIHSIESKKNSFDDGNFILSLILYRKDPWNPDYYLVSSKNKDYIFKGYEKYVKKYAICTMKNGTGHGCVDELLRIGVVMDFQDFVTSTEKLVQQSKNKFGC